MFRQLRRLDMKMSDEDINKLLVRGREGVISTFNDNDYPYAVAVNYIYYNDKIYFHCARKGQKLDNIKRHEKVSFLIYDNVEVLGEKLNTLYQSVVIYGRAKVLNASEEVLKALVNKYADISEEKLGRMIEKEINQTAMIEIEIDYISGKQSL
jgi:nitroimidazol reductase NimA-like FMN-containing flavoprotein (pyridoxamine 5'-phosphate oxidase superfamily)